MTEQAMRRMTDCALPYMIRKQALSCLNQVKILKTRRLFLPIGTGLAGGTFLFALYMGIVSLAESPRHAVDFFWQDRWIVIPIILGFSIQIGLYVILKKRLFIPVPHTGPSGALAGTSGTTSTLAMVACCAHHVTDVLPILGLTAAATFLAQYRIVFMFAGLGMTLVGISVMLTILLKERRRAIRSDTISSTMETA